MGLADSSKTHGWHQFLQLPARALGVWESLFIATCLNITKHVFYKMLEPGGAEETFINILKIHLKHRNKV